MSLLFRVIYAAHANGTHHKLAMDALRHLKSPDAEGWTRLMLKNAETYLAGSKAPDNEFKDFKNHVLHTRDGYWGGALGAVETWYGQLIADLQAERWVEAVRAAGILSHYVCDPIHPFHTAQSEAENNIHRAAEWSINRSYDALLAIGQAGAPTIELAVNDGKTWLRDLMCRSADISNANYERLIAHYDIHRGVVDPPAGLDAIARGMVADLIVYAARVNAIVLDRALAASGVKPPPVELALDTLLATLKIPLKLVQKKLANAADRAQVQSIYDELKTTGKVEQNLPEDDRAVRELHKVEVLAKQAAAQDQARAAVIAQAAPAPIAAPRLAAAPAAATTPPAAKASTAVPPVAAAARVVPPTPPAPPPSPAPVPASMPASKPASQPAAAAPQAPSAVPPPATPSPSVAAAKPAETAPARPAGSVPSVAPATAKPQPAVPSIPPSAPLAAPPAPAATVPAPPPAAAPAPSPPAPSAPPSLTAALARIPQEAPAGTPAVFLAATDDLEKAPSIGPKTAERFAQIGIRTVSAFLAADPAKMAEKLEARHLTPQIVADWQHQARLVLGVPGLRGTHAQLLVGAGYRTVEEVAKATPDKLSADVLKFAQSPDGQRILRDGNPPDVARIKSWCENARRALAA